MGEYRKAAANGYPFALRHTPAGARQHHLHKADCEPSDSGGRRVELLRLRAETKAGEKKMKYALYDFYEDDQGELICMSDDIAEIRAAAKLRCEETDGECDLRVMKKLTREEVTE